MEHIRFYNEKDKPDSREKERIAEFLFQHLEQYGDAKDDIKRAVAYALKEIESFGGFVIVYEKEGQIAGTVVVNRTGMKGYIPENILVYIATHRKFRGKGIGKRLMQETVSKAQGSIALHVEEDNPARFLYEKVGFDKKYLEMRYLKRGE